MQTVSWAGSTYNIPNQRGDTPWSGLSDFAIAVASKGINTGGGNFTLLADINLGGTFGLISTYYKSRSANIASAGILRLANTDTIKWRNAADDNDNTLSLSSNALQYNGADVIYAGAGLIVNADISASAAIAFSKLATLTSGNILVGSAGNVPTSVALSGDATLIASGALTLATVNSDVGSFTAANITVDAKGRVTAAANGTAGVSSVTGTANQITSSGGSTPVIALASPLITPGAVTVTGNLTFTPTTAGIVGTTTNDDAASGTVGQYIESVVTGITMPATGTYNDLASISLPAGDWDVTLQAGTNGNGAFSDPVWGISTTTGNSSAGLVDGSNAINFVGTFTINQRAYGSIATYRMSLSATTTVYAKQSCTFAGTAPTGRGRLSARRVR